MLYNYVIMVEFKHKIGHRPVRKAEKRRKLVIRNKKRIIIAVAAFVTIAGLIMLTVLLDNKVDRQAAVETILQNGVLRIGLRRDMAGMSYYDEYSDEYSGLEVDVAAALAQRLIGSEGVPVEIIPINTKSAVIELKNGDIDIAFGCFVSDDAVKGVSFTQPYYTDALQFLDMEKHPEVPVIGIVRNSYAQLGEKLEGYYEENDMPAEFKIYGAYQDAVMGYSVGQIDTLCAGGVMMASYASAYDKSDVVILPHGYCAMVASTRTELYRAINAILVDMEDDGTLSEIRTSWGLPDYSKLS